MKSTNVSIINYGAGNTGSVISALKYLGVNAIIVDDAKDLSRSEKLILPGVGSFKKAMENINSRGMAEAIKNEVLIMKKPILGICLGFQMLFKKSTEDGITYGLDLVPGEVDNLRNIISDGQKIPHIGFNQIFLHSQHKLFKGIDSGSDFYFVHSFGVDIKTTKLQSYTTTEYGQHFVSAVAEDNIMGTQFHPEKSQTNGLMLLNNFLEY